MGFLLFPPSLLKEGLCGLFFFCARKPPTPHFLCEGQGCQVWQSRKKVTRCYTVQLTGKRCVFSQLLSKSFWPFFLNADFFILGLKKSLSGNPGEEAPSSSFLLMPSFQEVPQSGGETFSFSKKKKPWTVIWESDKHTSKNACEQKLILKKKQMFFLLFFKEKVFYLFQSTSATPSSPLTWPSRSWPPSSTSTSRPPAWSSSTSGYSWQSGDKKQT